DVGAEPVNEQRAQGEPQALLEDLRLGEGREVEVSGELFGCGRHGGSLKDRARRDQASALGSSALGISTFPPKASIASTTPLLAWVTLKLTFLAVNATGPSTSRTPSRARRITPPFTRAAASITPLWSSLPLSM